jgi:hypothetical protein
MTKIIPFPIDENQRLTFDQCVSATSSRNPLSGLIISFDAEDGIHILNFGVVSRKDALWMAEMIRRHALGDPV